MHALAQAKITERAEIVGRAEALQAMALEQDSRDLSDNERQALAQYRSRVGEIDAQLALMTDDFQLDHETAANIAKWAGTPVPTSEPHAWRSVGAALWDYLHRDDREARQRINDFERIAQRSTSQAGRSSDSYIQLHVHNRAAQHMGTKAENTTPVAGGFGGLIVSPVAGPIIDIGFTGTPVLNALGSQDAPSPFGFTRPRIIDPNLEDGAGPQAGGKEKGELPSYKFDVSGEQVSMQLAGGYLNVSQQVISWIPSGLDIIIRQMTRRAQRASEKVAVTGLTGATVTVPLADATDPAAVRAAFGAAAVSIFNATGLMPAWVMTGPEGWGALYGLTDAAGRPLYPAVNPVNAGGSLTLSSMSGSQDSLPLVVAKGLGNDYYLGNAYGLEAYTINLPALEAVEPSVMGRQIAIAQGVGTYAPITTEAGPGNTPPAVRGGVVKIDVT